MQPLSPSRPILRPVFLLTLFSSLSLLAPDASPQTAGENKQHAGAPQVKFIRAIVIDDRLSALRREPDQRSLIVRRLGLGRPVYIFGSASRPGQPLFYRVAVSRRTRGWIHRDAIAVPGRSGDDQRIWNVIEANPNEVDRIALCRILANRFPRSPLAPAALWRLGEEAERVSKSLTQRARTRLASSLRIPQAVPLGDLYLNDAGLDRYNRLGVHFQYHEPSGELLYDGAAYREIGKRYPTSEQAIEARKRLQRPVHIN